MLAAAASLWVTLFWIFGTDDFRPILWPSIGMSGWLFQATWVPQHLMAGSCVVAAMLLMTFYARRPSLTLALMLALAVVAGFESSTFVGGVTFAIAGLAAAPILFAATSPGRRLRFVAGLAVAALLVVCLIAPFLRDQFATVAARGRGSPLAIEHYTVFGEAFPYWLRRIMDVPGYWLIILPIELPAIYIAGLIAFPTALRRWRNGPEKLAIALFACLAGAGLVTSWLLVSTLGENNDLGLRAIIPAEIVLIVVVAAVLTSMPSRAILIVAVAGLVLSLPDAASMIQDNVFGTSRPGGQNFRESSGNMGGGAPLRRAKRSRRQQSAVPRRRDPVAGEYFLGFAGQPQLVLCKPRSGGSVCTAVAGASCGDQRPVRQGVRRRRLSGRRARDGGDL